MLCAVCCLCVVCGSLFPARWMLSAVCSRSLVVCCSSFDGVYCWVLVACSCSSLLVVGCLLFVMCCLVLCVVRCFLRAVC